MRPQTVKTKIQMTLKLNIAFVDILNFFCTSQKEYVPIACATIPTINKSVSCKVEYDTMLRTILYSMCRMLFQQTNLFCSVAMTVTVVFKTSPMRK